MRTRGRAEMGVVVHAERQALADDLQQLPPRRVWLGPGRRAARGRGLPVVDHDFLDSFALGVAGKAERYVRALRFLPAGLSEWAVHPAVDEATAAEADLGWAVRRSDHAFLLSPLARRVLDEESIVVIDYRCLQRVWVAVHASPGP